MKTNLFLPIFIALGLIGSIQGMEPTVGTIVNPVNPIGQFTVPGINPGNQASGLVPVITSLGQSSSQIAQPTLISFAAGKAPWWALSVGTGYLLLCKCDMTNPALISSCLSGAGFATGNQVTTLLKNLSENQTINDAARALTALGCIGLTYTTNIALVQDAFFAMAQAIGIDATLEIAEKLLRSKKSSAVVVEEPKKQTNSSSTVPATVVNAAAQATQLGLQTAFVQLLHTYDPITLLRILLYEQTYRLAHKGYESAHQACAYISVNYKPLDPRKAACTVV